MMNINLDTLLYYLLSISGVAIILVSMFRKNKTASLLANGIKANGTVINLGYKSPQRTDSSEAMDKVTIEFTTKNKQVVAGDINQDFAMFYTGQYNIGDAVELYYDPMKPDYFYVITGQSEKNSRLLATAIGLILSVVGLCLIFFN